ncbi:hypothetical protein B0O99DRAFT_513541 [Bisporella sp. PMI_857]|nr:hypothetical protein B0O99DRAFT_513541 [Bisporella sp. PMI_857]
MRVTITSLLAMAVTKAIAQFYSDQTGPFNLIVLSPNQTLNGTALGACHEGAAIEALCTGFASPFRLNYTSLSTQDPPIRTVGLLNYLLSGSNFDLFEPMGLSYDPSSNVALPLFTPSRSGTLVNITEQGELRVVGFADDTVSPPKGGTEAYSRWWVCMTRYGYVYETLAWVLGSGVPQNPTCQKVELVRVFI